MELNRDQLFSYVLTALCTLLFTSGVSCDQTPSTLPIEPESDPLEGERINKFYTNEEIRYFLEIALWDTTDTQNYPFIVKWISEVRVSLSGDVSSEDSLVVQTTIDQLNRLIPEVKIRLDPVLPTLDLRFVPDSIESSHLWFLSFQTGSSSHLHDASIKIFSPSGSSSRFYAIQGGLAAGMGLYHQSTRYAESIFFDGPFYGYGYTPIDKTIIQIMYSPEVKPGMSWNQAVQALTNL